MYVSLPGGGSAESGLAYTMPYSSRNLDPLQDLIGGP
jgi:hypothetical protein